ncbi:hypothetical protein [Porphyromonas sp. COT-290 OH3588]|uniref:hypothetical protein n=1 Tax=Porphyromonas sp. COT-290 OH3588 TaxID=1515617 RepID=UPI00052D3976|nr:hypothetical protein [Porphyromonas sp. COT-290 OH3588]KGO00160.1 hypothetical protein HQ48_07070 [Porphyromonas sp. COT-290 OH3588]
MRTLFIVLPLLLCSLLLSSCSDERMESLMRDLVVAPPSTIERDVKGHEQIYSIQAILRLAHKRKDGKTFAAYDIPSSATPLPIYQEIAFSKDSNGKMSITSARKVFDVVKGEDIYYALELKYYDLNGRLINHQFSGYDPKDEANSTLLVHQHFFTVQGYALSGYPLVYPMTLDSIYYDKYLFQLDSKGNRVRATASSPSIVYAPEVHQPNSLRYSLPLAIKATEVALTQEAQVSYTDPQTGKLYQLYKTIDAFELNGLVPKIFTYEYRDTDPVEEVLGSAIVGQDDLGRIRAGIPVIRLRKKRSLDPGTPLDALGFKGVLKFHQSNMAFQMRTCISHIITANGKYDLTGYENPGGVHRFNQLSPAWNSFDIDYPVPFRIIADVDRDKDACVRDIQRFYPEGERAALEQMLWGEGYFDRIPKITM